MTRSLSSPKINFRTSGSLVNTLTDSSESSISHPAMNYTPSLADGVEAGQANRTWQAKSQTIAQGAQVTVDIRDFTGFDIGGGAGRDGVGQDLTLEEIVFIGITNDNANTASGKLEIKPASDEGWTPIGTHTGGDSIGGGGTLIKSSLVADAFDVTVTAHRITLRAVSGSVTWSMYIWGRSDDEASSSSSSESSSSLSSSSPSSSSSSFSQSTSASSQSTSSSESSSSSQSSSESSSSASSSESSSSVSSASSQSV